MFQKEIHLFVLQFNDSIAAYDLFSSRMFATPGLWSVTCIISTVLFALSANPSRTTWGERIDASTVLLLTSERELNGGLDESVEIYATHGRKHSDTKNSTKVQGKARRSDAAARIWLGVKAWIVSFGFCHRLVVPAISDGVQAMRIVVDLRFCKLGLWAEVSDANAVWFACWAHPFK